MADLTQTQVENWLRNRAAARIERYIPEWDITTKPDYIYFNHEERGGLRIIRQWPIPALAAKILLRVGNLPDTWTKEQIRDAVKAALKSGKLAQLMDEITA